MLLLGHYDTVWDVGTLGRRPLRREGNRLYGPGVFDMKAGLALGMMALRATADDRIRLAGPGHVPRSRATRKREPRRPDP